MTQPASSRLVTEAALAATVVGLQNSSRLTAVTITGAYTAAPYDLVLADATSVGLTVTLPAAPADRTRVAVKKTDTTINTVTIRPGGADTFTVPGGPVAATLTVPSQAVQFQYVAATGVWVGVSNDLPLAQLDARYAKAGSTAPVGIAAGFWPTGTTSVAANANTPIPLAATDYNDSTSYFTLSGGAITVLKAGLYIVNFYADCNSGGTAGSRSTYIKNGGTTLAEASTYTSGVEVRLRGAHVARLAANSTITLNAYFSTASSVLAAAAKDTGISIAYLGA